MDPISAISDNNTYNAESLVEIEISSRQEQDNDDARTKTIPSDGSTNAHKKKSNSSTIRQSFTADTPYFDAYVDRDLCHLTILTETLYDISARARAAGQCGEQMADATRKLSMACKLHPTFDRNGDDWTRAAEADEEGKTRERKICDARKVAVGKEMGSVLRILGEVLDEIADAQILMCESLEASLSLTLEAFANIELTEATRVKVEAEKQTNAADALLARYLQRGPVLLDRAVAASSGGNGSNSGGATSITTVDEFNAAVSSNWHKISDQVGVSSFFSRGGSSGSRNNSTVSNNNSSTNNSGDLIDDGRNKHKRVPKSRKNSTNSGEDHDHPSENKSENVQTAFAAASMRKMLEEIRLSQSNAELCRFQLLRRFDSLKTRRNYELGESAIAALNGIRAYFHHCSDLTQSLTPRLTRAQEEQNLSRDKHLAQEKPWERCESNLLNAIRQVEAAAGNADVIADAIKKGTATPGLGASVIADQPTTLSDIELEVQFWELPQLLAESSLYHREPKKCVIVEGWLYKKTLTRISTAWIKSWFILDDTGVYYMKQSDEHSSSPAVKFMPKRDLIKVCDILLCTVRELSENAKGLNGCRFCFEIISPNHKPYLLQAPGPIEYKRWVNGIRSSIEKQLFHGKVHPDGRLRSNDSERRMSFGGSSEAEGGDTPFSKPGGGFSNYLEEFLDASLVLSNIKKDDDELSMMTTPSIMTANSALSDTLKQIESLMASESGKGRQQSEVSITSIKGKQGSVTKVDFIKDVLASNPHCADCGASSPDWASLNLGVLVCIECSGIHRSLGVHVSKVRSIRLDELSKTEGFLLLSLGNKNANTIWEAGIGSQKGWTKPTAIDSQKKKEDFIKSKYLWKGFVDYKAEDGSGEERQTKFSMDLYEAARFGDFIGVAEALARGGSVDWKNDHDGGKTALHICALGGQSCENDDEDDVDVDIEVRSARRRKRAFQAIICAELLLQNGAKLDIKDGNDHGVLDSAVCGNAQREMIEFLSSRSS